MRKLSTLVLAFFLSGIVASAVQIQLGVYFKADVELGIAMVALAVMTLVTTLALGIALAAARTVSTVDAVAGALVGVTLLGLAVLIFFAGAAQRTDVPIFIEIVLPIVVMIAIQWWLMRRRWRRGYGRLPST